MSARKQIGFNLRRASKNQIVARRQRALERDAIEHLDEANVPMCSDRCRDNAARASSMSFTPVSVGIELLNRGSHGERTIPDRAGSAKSRACAAGDRRRHRAVGRPPARGDTRRHHEGSRNLCVPSIQLQGTRVIIPARHHKRVMRVADSADVIAAILEVVNPPLEGGIEVIK